MLDWKRVGVDIVRNGEILGCVLRMESMGFAAELNMVCEKKRQSPFQASWPEQLEAGAAIDLGEGCEEAGLILVQAHN